MQDTKNLKRKIKRYKKMISDCRASGDKYSADFWSTQLENIKDVITMRDKNRRKNIKQYNKKN